MVHSDDNGLILEKLTFWFQRQCLEKPMCVTASYQMTRETLYLYCKCQLIPLCKEEKNTPNFKFYAIFCVYFQLIKK